MGFLSLIIALLIEQVRPLGAANPAYRAVRSAAEALERNFNAGEKQHGVLAWVVLVLPLTIFVWGVYVLLLRVHPFLGLAWNALVLYLTLGFRQFSHYYTGVQLALADNDLPAARALLTEWKRGADPAFSAADLVLSDVCRVAIEEALVASHRHVFGVFFWFVVLPGPAGAVAYRVADFVARRWNAASRGRSPEPFGAFAKQAFAWIDWVPVRLTAVGFAVVGNFEDAVFSWRHHPEPRDDPSRGILIAAGTGALGVRLGAATRNAPAAPPTAGGPATDLAGDDVFAETMPGVEASPAALRTAVGLVWRSMLLWMLLLLLLSLAGLFG